MFETNAVNYYNIVIATTIPLHPDHPDKLNTMTYVVLAIGSCGVNLLSFSIWKSKWLPVVCIVFQLRLTLETYDHLFSYGCFFKNVFV